MNLRGSLRIPACCLLLLAFAKTASAQEPRLPVGAPAADIVKDNLSRAAATPEQILELLGKDSGLMVEFKQVLAKDAGINGQILIEADLSEGAIAERLHSDLRCRVLATALLRSYGYLLPRINPDSDPAAEHNLVLRERAQEIQRASERRGVTQEQARSERTNGCNARNDPCAPLEIPPSGDSRPTMQNLPEQERTTTPVLRATDGEIPNNLPFDAFRNDGDVTTSPVLLPKSQSVLASERQTDGVAEPDRLGIDLVGRETIMKFANSLPAEEPHRQTSLSAPLIPKILEDRETPYLGAKEA